MRFRAGRAMLVALGLGVTSAHAAEPFLDPGADRPPAPAFALDDLRGERVRLGDFGGKVVAISLWSTWCKPCLQELRFLQGFQERYAKDGLVVLALDTDGPETSSEVRSTVRRLGLSGPVLLDRDGAVAALLHPRGTQPYTIFVDRRGRVARRHEGFTSGDEQGFERLIRELLAEPQP